MADADPGLPYAYAVSYMGAAPLVLGHQRIRTAQPLDTWEQFKVLPETIRATLTAEGKPAPAHIGILSVLPLHGDWKLTGP